MQQYGEMEYQQHAAGIFDGAAYIRVGLLPLFRMGCFMFEETTA